MKAYFLSFAINLLKMKFKNRILDRVTITAHILDKGSLNITITANSMYVPRRMGILYLRPIRNVNDHIFSPVLTSSENRRDESIPRIIRKTKATQETNEPNVDSVIMIQGRKDFIMLIFSASVSKSLLIVLGTLLVLGMSLPAKNDREKYRIAGIERSRNAWSSPPTRLDHTSHRPCTSVFDLPAVLISLRACARRGTCGTSRTSRFPCSSRAHPSMMSHRLGYFWHVTTSPILPFVGLPLSRLMALVVLPAVVMRHMPNLDLPAVLVSLDNSCPPNSG